MNATDQDCTLVPAWDPLPPHRVVEAMEAMNLRKGLYDIHHPQHVKPLSVSELWRIARNKVVDELSDPTHTDALSKK